MRRLHDQSFHFPSMNFLLYSPCRYFEVINLHRLPSVDFSCALGIDDFLNSEFKGGVGHIGFLNRKGADHVSGS